MQGQWTLFRISRISVARRPQATDVIDRAEKIVLYHFMWLINPVACAEMFHSNCVNVLSHITCRDRAESLFTDSLCFCLCSFRFVSLPKTTTNRNNEPCDISWSSSLFMSAALWFYGSCLMLTKAGGTSCLSGPIKPQFLFWKRLQFRRAAEGQTNFRAFLSALLSVGGPPQVEGDTRCDCLFIAAADVHCQSEGVRSSRND